MPTPSMSGIKSFYDAVGGFGTLLIIVGKDWVTPQQSARSLERFMAEVAPRLAATCSSRAGDAAGVSRRRPSTGP